MASTVLAPQMSVAPGGPLRKRWTRGEVEAIEAAGLLQGQKLELVEGVLIDKMGKKRAHTIAVTLLFHYLVQVFSAAVVQQEAPIDVSPEDNPRSEPEPDLIVLNRPMSDFRDANPRPEDLVLVCEVSDTTLAFDLSTKANLYARAGISEYWVLDLQGRRLMVHREPAEFGYKLLQTYLEGESVTPLGVVADSGRGMVEVGLLLG